MNEGPGNGRYRFVIDAGALIRGRVKSSLLLAAPLDVDVKVVEAKGLLGSQYQFTATGPDAQLLEYQRRVVDLARRLT